MINNKSHTTSTGAAPQHQEIPPHTRPFTTGGAHSARCTAAAAVWDVKSSLQAAKQGSRLFPPSNYSSSPSPNEQNWRIPSTLILLGNKQEEPETKCSIVEKNTFQSLWTCSASVTINKYYSAEGTSKQESEEQQIKWVQWLVLIWS